jgi:hypothetical protein
MKSAGICVHFPKTGRPAAHVIVLEGSWEQPTVERSFNLTSSRTDLATILSDLGKSIESHFSGLAIDRAVVRRADFQRSQGAADGPKIRLLAEGTLTAFAKSHVEDVFVLTGKELTDRSPATSKAALDSMGTELGGDDYGQAASAALVGLTL